jgi:hypothetical protein
VRIRALTAAAVTVLALGGLTACGNKHPEPGPSGTPTTVRPTVSPSRSASPSPASPSPSSTPSGSDTPEPSGPPSA